MKRRMNIKDWWTRTPLRFAKSQWRRFTRRRLRARRSLRKRFASRLDTSYNVPCPSQSSIRRFVIQNPKFGAGVSDFEFRISNFIMTPMSSDGTVTNLIAELKAGKPEALEKLYRSYFPRLLGLARKRLSQSPRMLEDEEDVVQSVFRGFCELADRGLYPSLQNRNDLWLLLFTLTARKVGRLRRAKRLPREDEQGVDPQGADDEVLGLEYLLGHEPTPEEAVAFADEVKQKMDALQDDVLRQVALWKMESFTDEEIAQKLGCVTRTVERKLCVIRNTWESMMS
jgi:RNA polymerase sigma factor (sigma-70 family)